MPGDNKDQFATFTLPDVTKVDPSKIRKFYADDTIPNWRMIAPGLNLEGMCKYKNKKCPARGRLVWVNLCYGTFQMSQWVYKVVCPICKNPLSKDNKKIGIYQCKLTGRGRKVVQDAELTDDEDQKSTQKTENNDSIQESLANPNIDDYDVEKEEEFPKIVNNTPGGFLKMDGINGRFVQWRYMTLEIKKLPKK